MRFITTRLSDILQLYISGWTLAFLFVSIVRGEGAQEIGSVDMNMGHAFLFSVVAGPVLGLLSGYAQWWTERTGYRRVALRTAFLMRVVFTVLFLITIVSVAYLIYGQGIGLLRFAFEPGSFAIYLYIVTIDLLLFALRQVNLFLGRGNFWRLMRGKFYEPREETRVFAFLDLQSSTSHAEALGHLRYSRMIQDCFDDLDVVAEYGAEIYQYVGDEVVLTWRLKDGIKRQNCLRAIFEFQQRLFARRHYYKDQYRVVPFFKAGMHTGVVTAAEVGRHKKEIAYHGDTINTAARIQSQCNNFGQGVLISDELRKALKGSNFLFSKLGRTELKGKYQPTTIYAVNEDVRAPKTTLSHPDTLIKERPVREMCCPNAF